MKRLAKIRQSIRFAVLMFLAGRAAQVFANPTGLTVSAGHASMQQLGALLNVTVSQAAILNWQSFNIGAGETTSFLQPSANSVVFNYIGSANPSQIYGSLHANGTVILANANGFYFGPNSMIKVGGSFIATTAPLTPDFGAGATWQFTGIPPLASIVNYGQIEVGQGRSLFLIAENIENHGSLTAPAGDVGLYAGDTVMVSESPDGRGLSAAVTMPKGSVDNFGRVTADAGTIALAAQVVNQDGILQANSLQEKNGVIELVASDSLNLGANSQILAQGDNSAGGSQGGTVTLKSENNYSDATGSTIVTAGGANGGNGGNIEVSAPNIQVLNSAMDARAQDGFTAGEFLLDPVNIVLGTSTAGGAINVNTAFSGFSAVLLQATGNITLNANTAWDLSGSTGQTAGQLTLEAGGDIVFNKNSQIVDENAWNVSLSAGYASGSVQAGVGNIYLNGSNGGTVNGTIQTAASNINLAAGNSIQLGSGTVGTTGGNVTWQSGGNITFGKNSAIATSADGGVTLDAGYNFASGTINSGSGNVYLNGSSGGTLNGTITTAGGDINLLAGQNVLVGSGSVYTTGGGGIFAYAMTGNISAGSANGGSSYGGNYDIGNSGSTPTPVLGGIATAAGGNVTLIAGNNIDSTSKHTSTQLAAASGTYGSGDVNVIAGNQITGNYNLANGTGTMLAGEQVSTVQAGALQNSGADPSAYASTLKNLETAVTQSSNAGGNIGAAPSSGNPSTAPVTLGLINGSWNAWAANDLSLKEIINPNGAFNDSQSFLYNYALGAAANLWAGNAIELVGGSFGSVASSVNKMPIYAPDLSLNAGAGGILLDTSIILAPSSEGSLSITTRNGGNLTGKLTAGSTVLTGITMSDSGSTDYTTFSSGHAAVLLHLNDPNPQPVLVDVSGSIGNFSLTVPTFADITVDATQPFVTPTGQSILGTYNFAFKGQNLSPDQTTSINVLGSITYRGDVTPISLTTAQLADLLPTALFTDSADQAVTDNLRYDASTGQLIYVGVMSATDLNFLLNPTVLVLNKNGQPETQLLVEANGQPILDANGNPQFVDITKPLTLDATQQGMITELYNATKGSTLGSQGLAVAGAGHFNVSANSMDLGVSAGITVLAPDATLAAISPYGADLNVTTVGDLSMTSTTIANESLFGGINLNVGGALNVGGEFTAYDPPSVPKGIFTTSGGNISVIVNGDVNINGSRIAAYNGGNITVLSKTGDVNAGSGGAGYVNVSALELNPLTGQLQLNPVTGQPAYINASIAGSGILATTLFGSEATLGNILVEAPNGNIFSSQGGVIQISFNASDASKATAELLAGYELQDAGGNLVLAQNLANGTPVLALDDQNLVALGSPIQFLPSGSSLPVSLTPLLDAEGNPHLDASGNPLYIETSDASKNVVEIVNNSIQPLLDASGNPIKVAAPLAASGNPILVLGRNIDAAGSGIIAQNVVAKATGNVAGLFIGFASVNLSANSYGKGLAIGPTVDISEPGDSGPTAIQVVSPDPTVNGISGSPSPSDAASAPQTVAQTTDAASDVAKSSGGSDDDNDLLNKKKKGIGLAQKVGRVTVILPGAKKLSEKAVADNPL